MACALYCLWARRLLERSGHPWEDACSSLAAHYARTSAALLRELHDEVLNDDGARGSGYVVHTLHTAREALREASYADIAIRAVRFGVDTDTNAAVAGGIAGLVHGRSGIPEAWITGLRGAELVTPLLEELVAHRRHVVHEQASE